MNYLTTEIIHENIIQHLKDRGVDFEKTKVIVDIDSDVAVFLLYNMSGQLVGYQQYNPSKPKSRGNDPREQKYFTYVSKMAQHTIAVWGLETVSDENFLFVTEGIFDAIKLHNEGLPAIAALGNDPKIIMPWLKAMNKLVIVVADNDVTGNKLKKLGKIAITAPEPYKDLGEMPQEEVRDWLSNVLPHGIMESSNLSKSMWKMLKEETKKDLVFYHGTSRIFSPGDYILPPEKTGEISEKGRRKNLDKVFFTLDKGSAKIYAGRAVQSLGGTPHVYIVEPEGEISWLNQTKGTTVAMAPIARVIQEV